MIKEFLEFIKKEDLFAPGDRILLAVSGGMDSSAMAWLFHKCGFYFGIAHCNFGLRGMESDGDEYFVHEMAAKYGVPFYCKHFETEKYAQAHKLSIQMAARELRYAFFEDLVRQHHYKYIATAHHRTDEVETFFINLIRGTGIAGLTGYPARQNQIIRPLMFADRNIIEEHVQKQCIRYREDSSNSSDQYVRNKLRHNLMPLLKEINPNIVHTIRADMEKLENIHKLHRKTIELLKQEAVTEDKGVTKISIAMLNKVSENDACLFDLLFPFGFAGEIIHKISRSLNGQAGKVFMSKTHSLLKDREYLIITEIDKRNDICEYSVARDTKRITTPLEIRFAEKAMKVGIELSKDPLVGSFDLQKLQFPLKIRRWKRGDAFYPFGMRGKKKLSDYFTDKKFSLLDKENTWLLCSGDDIIWVIGQRTDNRYRVTPKTKRIYIASLRE
jgi:tRNA(Ile)-lysidine synthase